MESYEEIKLRHEGMSLRDIYLFHCEKLQKKVNSGVVRLLPRETDVFNKIRELDLSRNFISVNGFYPLLEVSYVCSRLETLCLRGNGLTNDVVAALCKVGRFHSCLAVLDCSQNPKVSTPGGQALLKLAQLNPRIRRIDVSTTLVPDDIIERIRKQTARNLVEFKAKDSTNGRTAHMEALIYDGLTSAQRGLLYQPVREMRLHESLRMEDNWSVTVDHTDPDLPPLPREEEDALGDAFTAYDQAGKNSGLLDFQQITRLFSTEMCESGAKGPDFERLFKRIDGDNDGRVTQQEASVLMRNYLHHEAVVSRNQTLQILRDCFVIAAEGQPSLDAAKLAEVSKSSDRKVSPERPTSIDLLMTYSKNEEGRVLEDDFVEAYVLHHVLANPVFRSIFVSKKKPLQLPPQGRKA